MKIAFTTKESHKDSLIDPRFGRAQYFLIYDEDKDVFKYFDNREIKNIAHGVGPKAAQKLSELGARVLITGNGPGENASLVLEKAGIDVFVGSSEMDVKEAYQAFRKGKLEKL